MRRHYHHGEQWEGLTCFEREALSLLRELANLSHRQFRELDRIRLAVEKPTGAPPAVAFGMKLSKPKQEKD